MLGSGLRPAKISPRGFPEQKKELSPNRPGNLQAHLWTTNFEVCIFYQSLWRWMWMAKNMVLTLKRDTAWQNILFLKLINKGSFNLRLILDFNVKTDLEIYTVYKMDMRWYDMQLWHFLIWKWKITGNLKIEIFLEKFFNNYLII
jgi:hypothetical protein